MKMFSLRSLRSLAVSAVIISLTSVLAGCSKEPSAQDIEKMMRADAAGSKNTIIHEVRKVGCAPAQGALGYMCDVELDATIPQPFFGTPIRNKSIVKLRFFEDEGKWKVSVN